MPRNTIVAAGGMSDHERRKKAQAQPRDGKGRWIREGAFVRWRADGQDWAGTVDSIENGIAKVTAKMKDGSTTTRSLKTDSLSVTASKARLSSYSKRYSDIKNSTDRFLGENRPAIEEAAKDGGALIEREDGYSVEVGLGKPKDGDGDGVLDETSEMDGPGDQQDKEDKSKGNPLVFQLYAPRNVAGGASGPSPSAGQSLGIYNEPVSIDEVISDHKAYNAGEGEGEAAPAAVTASSTLSFSVPANVRNSIKLALEDPTKFSAKDVEIASKFCDYDQVGPQEVKWIYNFFSELEGVEDLYGGYSGRKWANKIMDNGAFDPIEHDFDESDLEYFAVSNDSDLFTGLIGVDFTTGAVYSWTGHQFEGPIADADVYEADYMEPVDPESAREIAYIILDHDAPEYNTMDLFPEERNLFALADKKMDWALISSVSQFSYETQDRSIDAQSQARGEGGKFGTPNVTAPTVSGTPEADTNQAVEEAATTAEAEAEQTGSTDPQAVAKYFAVVDEVDKSSVMDLVTISSVNGAPTVFRRTQGQWTIDPDMLTKLSGAAPPTVVHLTDEEEIREVVKQIDAYDSGEDLPEESSTMFGPYGEVVTAAGVPGVADTPSDWAAVKRLKDYWKYGAGAAKIRWGTKGDLTRAAKHLAKYVKDPWGFAQTLHMELFGVSNYKKDNG